MINKTIIVTFFIMISNVLVKIIGLLRDVALANTYGTSSISDAYIIAVNIPTILFSILATATSTTFIPIYTQIEEEKGKKESLKFTNNYINIIIIISLLSIVVSELITPSIVKLFAYGFNQETFNLTVDYTRIMLPSMLFIAVMGITGSYLQVSRDYLPISYVTLPSNILIIIAIFISFYIDKPEFLAYGTLLGVFSQLVFYYPFIKRNGFRYQLYINLKEKYIQQIILMIIPILIGAAVNEINLIIDRSLVSNTGEGSIAALNYSSKIIGFITGIFIVSLMTIIYPTISDFAAKKQYNELKKYIIRMLTILNLILLPISLITILYSKEIIRVIFERGNFDSNSTYLTGLALSAYSIGIIGLGYRELLTKVFFSFQDTKTPMINGIVAIIINLFLNIILINKIGFIGSAIATSIVNIITGALLMRSLSKSILKIEKNYIKNLLKIVISSICSILIGYILFKSLPLTFIKFKLTLFIFLMLFIILSLVIYYIFLSLLNEIEIYKLNTYIYLKIKRRYYEYKK